MTQLSEEIQPPGWEAEPDPDAEAKAEQAAAEAQEIAEAEESEDEKEEDPPVGHSPKVKRTAEWLDHEFSEEELDKFKNDLATSVEALLALQKEKGQAMASFASRIKEMEGQIGTLAGDIKRGKESRNTRCEIRFNNPVSGEKTTVRLDTGEEVCTVKMDRYELQEYLPFKEF